MIGRWKSHLLKLFCASTNTYEPLKFIQCSWHEHSFAWLLSKTINHCNTKVFKEPSRSKLLNRELFTISQQINSFRFRFAIHLELELWKSFQQITHFCDSIKWFLRVALKQMQCDNKFQCCWLLLFNHLLIHFSKFVFVTFFQLNLLLHTRGELLSV